MGYSYKMVGEDGEHYHVGADGKKEKLDRATGMTVKMKELQENAARQRKADEAKRKKAAERKDAANQEATPTDS